MKKFFFGLLFGFSCLCSVSNVYAMYDRSDANQRLLPGEPDERRLDYNILRKFLRFCCIDDLCSELYEECFKDCQICKNVCGICIVIAVIATCTALPSVVGISTYAVTFKLVSRLLGNECAELCNVLASVPPEKMVEVCNWLRKNKGITLEICKKVLSK
jgi:hypothetical protein